MATIKTSLRVENSLKDELEYENLKKIVDNNGKTAEDIRNPGMSNLIHFINV